MQQCFRFVEQKANTPYKSLSPSPELSHRTAPALREGFRVYRSDKLKTPAENNSMARVRIRLHFTPAQKYDDNLKNKNK